MFKLKIFSMGNAGRKVKMLTSVFDGNKENSDKSNAWNKELVHYMDNNRRRNYIECHTTMLYSLCYEHREDGTIRII